MDWQTYKQHLLEAFVEPDDGVHVDGGNAAGEQEGMAIDCGGAMASFFDDVERPDAL